MKKTAIIALVSAAGGGLVVWLVLRQPPETTSAASSAQGVKPAAVQSPVPAASAGVSPAPAARPGASAAEKAVAGLRDQVVVSYGKVEDIGRQTAVVMLAKRELYDLKSVQIPDRTPEQRRRILELERQRAQVLGMLPEVAAFQNNPDEYSAFFTSMIKEAAALDDAKSKAVNDYMRARGEAMIAAGLNDAREPQEPGAQSAWEEKRDAFNVGTVDGVAALLPPGEADRIGFNAKFMELLEEDFDRAE